MKTFNDFKEHFNQNLQEELAEIEQRRKDIYGKKLKMGGLTLLGMFFHYSLVYLNIFHPYTIFFTLIAAPPLMFKIYMEMYYDPDVADDFKGVILSKMLQFIDPSLSYDPTGYVPYEEFDQSDIFLLRPDAYIGDDLISGYIDGIPMQFSEIKASYKERRKKGRKVEEKMKFMFDGVFLSATLDQPFKTDMQLFASNLYRNLGYVGRIIQQNNSRQGYYVQTQHTKFHQVFVAYADNVFAAQDILTQKFVKQMLFLRKRFKKGIYFSIKGNKVFLAAAFDRDLFKVNLKRSFQNPLNLKSFYQELYNLVSTFDDMDLDQMAAGGQQAAAPNPMAEMGGGMPSSFEEPPQERAIDPIPFIAEEEEEEEMPMETPSFDREPPIFADEDDDEDLGEDIPIGQEFDFGDMDENDDDDMDDFDMDDLDLGDIDPNDLERF